VYSEVGILDLSNRRNKRGTVSLSVNLVQATYMKGSYVIREPEVGMTRRLGIVGLEDEVSSHVYLGRYYTQDWNHRTS
jgi:hypothetical protein